MKSSPARWRTARPTAAPVPPAATSANASRPAPSGWPNATACSPPCATGARAAAWRWSPCWPSPWSAAPAWPWPPSAASRRARSTCSGPWAACSACTF
ncbi:hypothetical protein ACFSHR_18480 [Azotobacter chroococcum]